MDQRVTRRTAFFLLVLFAVGHFVVMRDETFYALCGQKTFGMRSFRRSDAAIQYGEYQEHREETGHHSSDLAIAREADKKLLTACRPFYSEVPAG